MSDPSYAARCEEQQRRENKAMREAPQEIMALTEGYAMEQDIEVHEIARRALGIA